MTDTISTETTSTDAATATADVQTMDTSADGLSTTDATDSSTEGTETDGAPVPEAKKYRQRAQQAEAERDTLKTRLDAMLKVEASRVIESEPLPLHNPADLFEFGGVTVDDLQDEHGLIDPAKVTTALDNLRSTRPYLFTERKAVNIGQGDRESLKTAKTWKDALKR